MNMIGGSWKNTLNSNTHTHTTLLFQSLDKKRGGLHAVGRRTPFKCYSDLERITLTVSLSLSPYTTLSRSSNIHSWSHETFTALLLLRLSALRQSASSGRTRSQPKA